MQAVDPVLARLVDRVRQAGSRGEPLDIRGGGTKDFYGGPAAGEPIEVGPFAGISSYEPTELVVTARAGTPLAELEAALEPQGQCLPFEPPRFASGGTVGGMVAAGLAGPARAYVGGVRDHVLGLTLLNGRGEVLTFGGQVAKNVAGYDVSRLMAGSLGILGILCEVSIKVLPLPRSTVSVAFECGQAGALEMLRGWASQSLSITATAWCAGCLHVRLAGAAAALQAACAKLGGEPLAAERAASWWRSLRDHGHAFFAANMSPDAPPLWRLSVPAASAPLALPGEQLIEWHGALRWWRTAASVEEVRGAAERAGGHATLMRGGDRMRAFTPPSAPLMEIHRRLKQAFDPAGVFNRGRLYAGL